MRRVLVLRPEPGASETVRRARELGLDVVAVPLFEIEPVEWQVPDAAGFDALLLTSANAIRHGGDGLQALRGLAVYAVGEATASAAREAGFDIRASGDSGVDRLLESIEPGLRLLQLCGEDRKAPESPRQDITPVVVYRATPVEAPDLWDARGAVALVHSPRAAHRFADLVENRGTVALAAISDAAAEQAGDGWGAVEVADAPRDEALLALAARLCNKPAGE